VDFPKEIDSIDELLRFGHNFVRFTDYSKVFSRASSFILSREYSTEAHIDEIINRAMSSGSLTVKYQPMMSASGGNAPAVETVIELNDEVYGSIDTELLISSAEENGTIYKLENLVMDEAFAFAGSEELAAAGGARVHIRLSVLRCMQMNLTDTIWQLRDKHRVPPERIAFEIRESAYENMSSVFDENLKKLSAQGYTIVLEGFGRGYSNMQHLLDMPIKAVKLDSNLVSSASSAGGRAILDGIIKMLRTIPLEVIAGGADDKETADMLCSMGCDMIQGHYYADPVLREEFGAVTESHG
jgi:EAL domain-containing protein (putative c-di-GMP-specific phosphodiesterase class I)